MRDHQANPDEGASDCPDDVRDLLPALLHGRLAGAERARAEAHVAGCAACGAELALLGDARATLVATAPAVNVAAIAAAVRTATIPAGGAPAAAVLGSTAPLTVPSSGRTARAALPTSVTRASRWRGVRTWRALAATALLAVGSGALVLGRGIGDGQGATSRTTAAPVVAAAAPVAPAASVPAGPAPGSGAAPAATRGATRAAPTVLAAANPALGTAFDDLSDDELQAVLDAVTGDEGALPSAEPEAALPAVEVRGGR